ncbi:COP9 subunit 3, putative [Talaromyces stipitatus ATCC 10500]|uniref:COP9 subunit 3, putative n=1 Tax=Talaromyces stipitatus (strain ATCC 10500 / CBS 375.48 / QM 6759 / NRRL 1006) TaxID=441959 RepID=B8M0Y1_TALSN|nr:COP9 subunit 3, putative [Talaromyces stipitatus ATCC 10500]EED21761.1 COP9 subunit 3, putative [Talaromyces stipitatus ATCC 10500]
MDHVLHQLRSFPSPADTSHEAYETHALEYYVSTRKHLQHILDSPEKAQNVLELLDPSTHSLAYLLVLNFYINQTKLRARNMETGDLLPGNILWSRALSLLKSFDPNQIRRAAREWRNVLEFISGAAEAGNKALLAIRPVRDAIIRMDPTCATFTVAHLYLTRLCLLAKAYKVARPVIDRTIFAIPSSADRLFIQHSQGESGFHGSTRPYLFEPPMKLTYAEHLQYFIYGGMIYMALKEWSKARHFLSIVITCPVVNAVSLIMVEAYKKWVLVNLIENGTTASVPKITSPLAMKTYKALARPYDALATAFISGKWERLKDEAEAGQTIWSDDNNNGLVQQVLLSFRKKAVRGLGATFASVTTTDVSQRALSNSMDVRETERYIVALAVKEGFPASLIHPSRDPNTSMLRFLTDHSESSIGLEVSLEEQLRSQHQKLELLIQNIQTSDRKLELSKEYISHLRKAQKRNDAASKGTVGFSGRKRDQNVDLDEDMMDELQ